jgi:hypothetical protein
MGPGELALVLIIVVIVFGSAKLPSLGDRLQVLQARSVRQAPRSDDRLFIGTLAVVLSFVLAVAAVVSSRHH